MASMFINSDLFSCVFIMHFALEGRVDDLQFVYIYLLLAR